MDDLFAHRRERLVELALIVFDENEAGLPSAEGWWTSDTPMLYFHEALSELGQRIARKRAPIPPEKLRRFCQRVESELASDDHGFANAVATNLLEAIWRSAHGGGFDFATIDPFLGRNSRTYFIGLDDFFRVQTNGLTRK